MRIPQLSHLICSTLPAGQVDRQAVDADDVGGELPGRGIDVEVSAQLTAFLGGLQGSSDEREPFARRVREIVRDVVAFSREAHRRSPHRLTLRPLRHAHHERLQPSQIEVSVRRTSDLRRPRLGPRFPHRSSKLRLRGVVEGDRSFGHADASADVSEAGCGVPVGGEFFGCGLDQRLPGPFELRSSSHGPLML